MITTNTVELLTGPAQNVSLVEQAFMWAGTVLLGSIALLTVMAVLDGSVAEIYEDALMGTSIRIDHGAGLESRYCGLVVADGLQVGSTVTAGQTIGRANDSNLAESAQETHLHLEMTEDGLYVDPMTILK